MDAEERLALAGSADGLAVGMARKFWRRAGRPGDVEDMVQEARLALARAARAFDPAHPRAQFRHFAARAVRNHLWSKVLPHLRRWRGVSTGLLDGRHAGQESGKVPEPADARGAAPGRGAELRDDLRALREALSGMGEGLARVVVLRAQGRKFREVGKALGINKETARKRWLFALSVLRARLGGG